MDLNRVKESLEERRNELLGEQQARIREVETSHERSSADQIDQAADAADFELTVDLAWRGGEELDAILAALRRIDGGGYGSCVACDDQIGVARLEALPTARLCISCQRRAEAGEEGLGIVCGRQATVGD